MYIYAVQFDRKITHSKVSYSFIILKPNSKEKNIRSMSISTSTKNSKTSIKSEVNMHLPDEYSLYGGKKIIPFDLKDNNMKKVGSGWYLSNNFVVVPHHCLCEGELVSKNTMYNEELADVVVMKVSEEVKSLTPILLVNNNSLNLFIDDNQVVSGDWFFNSEFLATFKFDTSLEPGNSGRVIFHSGNIKNKFNSEIECGEVPLFMVIARSKADPYTGLTIYLPLVLHNIRLEKVLPELRSCVNLAEWEFISTFGTIKKKVAAEIAEKVSNDAYASKLQNLKRSGLDTMVIDKLIEMEEKDLLNALVMSELVGPADTERCWVVLTERDESTPTSSKETYFKTLSNFIVLHNISETEESADKSSYKVFPSTSRPITLNKASYDHFNIKLGDDHTACHHPMLCELNLESKGKQQPVQDRDKKKKPIWTKDDTGKDTPQWALDTNGKIKTAKCISHCCIRPSHLVTLNKNFNDFCTVVMQGMGKNHVHGELKVTW